MATSNSTAFNMEFTEIAEEAFERAGREMRSGYDLKTARRSMNLLTLSGKIAASTCGLSTKALLT